MTLGEPWISFTEWQFETERGIGRIRKYSECFTASVYRGNYGDDWEEVTRPEVDEDDGFTYNEIDFQTYQGAYDALELALNND